MLLFETLIIIQSATVPEEIPDTKLKSSDLLSLGWKITACFHL